MPLPGVAAIAFYLLLVAGTIVLGVVGGHYPAFLLLFSVLFIAASGGMIASFRWAWALGLAAVFSLTCYNAWIFSHERTAPTAIQGLLNLLFFLYLIRPEVRDRLR
ncbi:MAG TPA: hypothetical protein VG225_00455 [Terracidiphilus sp.]|jgi:hypothetical protein|nr:hypothetical protein [Terracidiphilus sp.]